VVRRSSDAFERRVEVDLHRGDVGAARADLLPVPEDGVGDVAFVLTFLLSDRFSLSLKTP
jgi:hypothetical protein